MSDSNEQASASGAPPALNLAPTKKTEVDLFARAPQVKKMTRKEKQRLALSAAMGESAAATAAAKGNNQKRKGPAGSATNHDGIFATVFAEEAKAIGGGAGTGDVVGADGEPLSRAARQSGRKKNKKQILRHALHKNEEEDVRTVFVGNLPNTIDKKEVAKVFKDCGAIESVRVRCQALESSAKAAGTGADGAASTATAAAGHNEASGQVQSSSASAGGAATGRKDVGRAVRVLRGEIKKDAHYSATAYVLFTEASSVAVAIEKKNGVVFKNRHLVVTALDASSAAYPPDTSIFLGNLAYSTTEEDVWQFFTENGISDVKRVRLVRDRESGDCKGFGYVEFHSKASVEPAIATRGASLNDRYVRIVHVNKSKDVKAVTASRREKRGREDDEHGGGGSSSSNNGNAGQRQRGNDAKRARTDDAPRRGGEQPSWMGMTTNPRRKIPRDLRPLSETNVERKFKGPRPVVKRKMRNPEK